MVRLACLPLALSALAALPAHAGWLDDAVQSAVKNTGTRAVNEGAEAVYNSARESAKKGPASNNTGAPAAVAPAPSPAAVPVAAGTAATPASAPAAGGAGAEGAGAGAGDGAIANEASYNKFDFIPGDKVILADDFSDTDIGEFPRKWTLKGPRGGGDPVEVIKYAGQNWLSASGYSWIYLRLNKKGDMPEKFTIECDVVFGGNDGAYSRFEFLMPTAANNNKRFAIGAVKAESDNNSLNLDFRDKQDKKIHHLSVSVNGTFLKAYVDNVRVLNDPDGIQRPIQYVGIGPWASTGNAIFSNFRLAEGGKNIKSAIDTDGKIVTHGILFDTGSDTIRPESTATLRMIQEVLAGNPNLKFSIEGHTDNQGSVDTNQALSEKRAAAVKSWLVAKGIGADRLKTRGWGQSKPMDSNESAEGRANNRRVEFIKL